MHAGLSAFYPPRAAVRARPRMWASERVQPIAVRGRSRGSAINPSRTSSCESARARTRPLRLRLVIGRICVRDILQLLLPVRTVSWSVFEAALRGRAAFTCDEVDVYVTAGLALELLVAAPGVGELSKNVQVDGLSVRQQLPAVPQ